MVADGKEIVFGGKSLVVDYKVAQIKVFEGKLDVVIDFGEALPGQRAAVSAHERLLVFEALELKHEDFRQLVQLCLFLYICMSFALSAVELVVPREYLRLAKGLYALVDVGRLEAVTRYL